MSASFIPLTSTGDFVVLDFSLLCPAGSLLLDSTESSADFLEEDFTGGGMIVLKKTVEKSGQKTRESRQRLKAEVLTVHLES